MATGVRIHPQQLRDVALLFVPFGLAVVLKFGAYWSSGALSLMADALAAFGNLLVAGTAVASFPHTSARSGRQQTVQRTGEAGGVAGGVLLLTAAGIAATTLVQSFGFASITIAPHSVALALLATALCIGAAQTRSGTVSQTQSNIDTAALYLKADIWMSIGVLSGLALIAVTGWRWIDLALALSIMLRVARHGARLLHCPHSV